MLIKINNTLNGVNDFTEIEESATTVFIFYKN